MLVLLERNGVELVDVLDVVVLVEADVLVVDGVTVPRVVSEVLRDVEVDDEVPDVVREPLADTVVEAVREPVDVVALVREPVVAVAAVLVREVLAFERIAVPVEVVRELTAEPALVEAVLPTLVAFVRLTPAAATLSL